MYPFVKAYPFFCIFLNKIKKRKDTKRDTKKNTACASEKVSIIGFGFFSNALNSNALKSIALNSIPLTLNSNALNNKVMH